MKKAAIQLYIRSKVKTALNHRRTGAVLTPEEQAEEILSDLRSLKGLAISRNLDATLIKGFDDKIDLIKEALVGKKKADAYLASLLGDSFRYFYDNLDKVQESEKVPVEYKDSEDPSLI